MDPLNSELDQLNFELGEIFFACPSNQEGEVKIHVLLGEVAVKFGKAVSDILEEELEKKSFPNDMNQSVTRDEFVNFVKTVLLSNSEEETQPNSADFSPPEYLESKNSSNSFFNQTQIEEVENNNVEVINTLQVPDLSFSPEDLRYLKDSKESLEKKLLRSESNNHVLEERLKSKTVDCIKFTKEIENLKQNIKKYINIEDECNECKVQIKNFEISNKRFKDELRKAQSKMEELEESKFSLVTEKNHLEDECSKKSLILQQLEAYNNSLYNELNAIKFEKDQFDKEIKKLNSELFDKSVLLDRITELTNEKQNLQLQLSDLNASNSLNTMSYSNISLSPDSRMMVCTTPFKVDESAVSLKSELLGIGLDDSIANNSFTCECQNKNYTTNYTQTDGDVLLNIFIPATPSAAVLNHSSCQTTDYLEYSSYQNENYTSSYTQTDKMNFSSFDFSILDTPSTPVFSNCSSQMGDSLFGGSLQDESDPLINDKSYTKRHLKLIRARRSLDFENKFEDDKDFGTQDEEISDCDMELCTSPRINSSFTSGVSSNGSSSMEQIPMLKFEDFKISEILRTSLPGYGDMELCSPPKLSSRSFDYDRLPSCGKHIISNMQHQIIPLQKKGKNKIYKNNNLYNISYFTLPENAYVIRNTAPSHPLSYLLIQIFHELTKCSWNVFGLLLLTLSVGIFHFIGVGPRTDWYWRQFFSAFNFLKYISINLNNLFSLKVSYPYGPPPC